MKINILGVNVDPISVGQLHAYIFTVIQTAQKALVLNVNVNCLNLAYENPWLKTLLNDAEIVFCDGSGVRLAALLLGQYLPRRITYADWMWQFCDFCAQKNITLYFLGGKPGVALQAAEQLRLKYPSIAIVGCQDGYFNKAVESAGNKAVVAEINSVKPNVLVLGFGMPLQEQWLKDNWDTLDVNIALTGGAVFDYVSGAVQRGSDILVSNGFEWLARLLIEPKRLWKRYIIGNPLFFWRLFWYHYVSRIGK